MTTEFHATGIDRVRQLARKVMRNARDKNKWRKVVKVRLWMPVALQVLLIIGLLWYTDARFPGFINRTNIFNILLLAMPLVGYLDLSVGAMISFGVVVGSFLMGADASAGQIALAAPVILGCGVGLGLVNAGLVRGVKIPSLIATLATLSILDGISLTLRPTAQGVISGDLVSWLTKRIGPIPIGARRARSRFRRAGCQARWHTHQLAPGAGADPLEPAGGGSSILRHGPITYRQSADWVPVRPQQHHSRRTGGSIAGRRAGDVRR
jgi:hypothetical protein